ncbi:MAG: hypothetical protein ABEI27_03410 [Halobellus sp.]|uniref:DNA replication complex subunit Gins51 n=1 Tax=Halobellus sp. TaxID=1979212 RepID=UPI0035D4AF1F
MDLDELRSVQRTERQKDSLQHLRDSFYGDVADYIQERKAERKRAAAAVDDPFGDPGVGELTDEIETAEEVVEAIYERRVGKVVKLASFAAADMSADTNGLTAEERDLFDDLVERIKQNRQTILDVLAGEGCPAADGTDANSAPSDQMTKDSASAESQSPGEADSGVAEIRADAPSPDDVLTEAMGQNRSNDPAPSTATTGTSAAAGATDSATAEATDLSSDTAADHPSDGSGPAVPPNAPSDAATTEAPVVGAETEDATGQETALSEDDQRTARDGGRPAEGGQNTSAARGGSEGSERRSRGDDTERLTLRITEDVGRILGVDEREYDLAAEDVVTLPSTNAGPLIERDAAERLE